MCNVQFGQRVVVRCAIEHAAVARAVATQAYRAGASHVSINYLDPVLQRAAVDHAPENSLGLSLPHHLEGVRAWREDRPAIIALSGNPHPRLMEGADPKRLAASVPLDLVREIMSMIGADHVAWTVAGAPNPAWAESIFGIPDVDRLWRAIAVATRLDERDPVDAWRAHLARPAEGAGAAINFDKGDALVAMALTVTGSPTRHVAGGRTGDRGGRARLTVALAPPAR